MDDLPVESAGFGIRTAARLIDYASLFVMSGVAFAVLAFFGVSVAAATDTPASQVLSGITERSYVRVSAVVALALYHTFAESVGGATLGKRLLGLEVVGETLRPATLMQTWKRSLAFLVDGFFFGLVGYNAMSKSPERQRLGDRYGETRVVLRRSLPGERRRPTRIFVFALLGAFGIGTEGVIVTQLLLHWLFA